MKPLRKAAGLLLLVIVLYSIWAAISSMVLFRRGQAFERAIQTEAITDPSVIWNQWTELSRDNPSSSLLRGPRKLVRQKLVQAADRVISSYRNSDAVYESGWKTARGYLANALAMDPDDTVRGKLRLTEGHLARISGTTRHNTSELNDAVEKFNEAQRLMPDSPDPALGLARVYVYGLHDIDRGYQALEAAEKHGHPLGAREKAQLADGYRDRGNRVYWESRKVRDLPQEKDELLRALSDYQRSLELYENITPYGNSAAYSEDVQASLDSIQNRLHEIEHKGVGRAVTGALERLLRIWR
jgi:tetratricopeptide (TPR) repeat protein